MRLAKQQYRWSRTSDVIVGTLAFPRTNGKPLDAFEWRVL